MKLPALNARRVALLARRDFMGYVKTVGFWITVLSPFLGLGFGLLMASLTLNAEPVRYAAVLDETGRYESLVQAEIDDRQARIKEGVLKTGARFTLNTAEKKELDARIETGGYDGGKVYLQSLGKDFSESVDIPQPKVRLVPLPAPDLDALMPYIKGERDITVNGAPQQLSGVLQFTDTQDGPRAKYWTIYPSAANLSAHARNILRSEARDKYFAGSELSADGYGDAVLSVSDIEILDPGKTAAPDGSGQAVTMADKIPYFVAAALSGFLWLTVFSGAYMLLMSMVEEKINKALEMLLASTRFTEILVGKLLGVAALTIATMLPWLLMGSAGLVGFLIVGDNVIAQALLDALSLKLMTLFVIFFILGYVFYGALFMALGSLAESMQDAQTLVTPILILLTLCVMVVPIGLESPDSRLVEIASFVPFSAPFAILVRLPGDPPMWQIFLSAGILFASAIVVMWLAARAFRYGVLSGGGLSGIKSAFGRLFSRNKTAP